MKIIKKTFLAFSLVAYLFISCNSKNKNYNEDELLISSVSSILNQFHFFRKNINDAYFDEVLESYFNAIDLEKNFFLEEEYQNIKQLNALDEEGSFTDIREIPIIVEEIFNLRGKKLRKTLIDYLENPIDYNQDEFYETDSEKKVFANSEAELIQRWKLRLKNNIITDLIFNLEEKNQEKKAEEKIVIGSEEFREIEKKAREDAVKSVKKIFNELINRKPRDYFNIYVNALTQSYDRYSNYFPPVAQETFNLDLSGKLEGIGAQINKAEDGSIEIVSIIPGGPSFKQKKLAPGDRILKVGQGEDGELVDVTSLTINEGLSLLRGKKGTKVRLYVKKIKEKKEEEIIITRDVIIIQTTYARSAIFENEGENYGYLYLPGFYRDFNDGISRNSSDDVKDEIEKLMKDNIKGLVFDLRNDGGGSLQDAVKIAGLFIESGPIVRVKSNQEEHAPLYDRDNNILYNQTLVFLINENSASASEIVAAALQDYERAIILGTEKSFGKGTVQTTFDLNQINILKQFDRNFGGIKLTIQKFYRVTGKSTQNIGVVPDVIFPSLAETITPINQGFQYDSLEPIPFKKWDNSHKKNYQLAMDKVKTAINQDTHFEKIKEKVDLINNNKEKTKLTLNLEKRLAEREEFNKKLENLNEEITQPFSDFVVKVDQNKKEIYGEEWYESLSKDIQVNYAMKLLKDIYLSSNSNL